MKRKLSAIILTVGLVASSLVGCGSSASNDKTIKIGASVTPHAEILNGAVKEQLEKEGYTLEVVEYNDFVLPNTALNTGELDANFFQHQPYLDNFNVENKTELVSVAKVHFEPFGIYAGKSSDLKNLKEGATVAVPNDTTNEARALLLLEAQGLIKLDPNAGLNATVVDIKENPLNLKIKEIEAAQIARSLQDVDIACINGNYAISGGLKVSDALAVEAADSDAAKTYANIVAVKVGNEENEKTKALVKAINSDEVKKYIEEHYSGAVVAVF
ncbi:MAG: MetQ/NlpA family ABC transporter substrate-binding protein [bacterium]|nr:MetQ/NlpA family ABC transporter substrate-binding protein [bacterium]